MESTSNSSSSFQSPPSSLKTGGLDGFAALGLPDRGAEEANSFSVFRFLRSRRSWLRAFLISSTAW